MNDVQRNDFLLLSCLLDLRKMVDNQFEGMTVSKGICVHVDRLWDMKTSYFRGHYIARLSQLFGYWPECSDVDGFPVPSPIEGQNAHDIYYNTSNVWIDEYGAARIRLLDFLIEQLQGAAGNE